MNKITAFKVRESYVVFVIFVVFVSYATVDYKVFSYFKGFLSIEIIRSLGGGSVLNSIYYIASEVYDTVPYAIAVLLIFLLACFFVNRIKVTFIESEKVINTLCMGRLVNLLIIIVLLMSISPIIDNSLFCSLNKNFVSKLYVSSNC